MSDSHSSSFGIVQFIFLSALALLSCVFFYNVFQTKAQTANPQHNTVAENSETTNEAKTEVKKEDTLLKELQDKLTASEKKANDLENQLKTKEAELDNAKKVLIKVQEIVKSKEAQPSGLTF